MNRESGSKKTYQRVNDAENGRESTEKWSSLEDKEREKKKWLNIETCRWNATNDQMNAEGDK